MVVAGKQVDNRLYVETHWGDAELDPMEVPLAVVYHICLDVKDQNWLEGDNQVHQAYRSGVRGYSQSVVDLAIYLSQHGDDRKSEKLSGDGEDVL